MKKIKRKLLPKLLISQTLTFNISVTECPIEIKFQVQFWILQTKAYNISHYKGNLNHWLTHLRPYTKMKVDGGRGGGGLSQSYWRCVNHIFDGCKQKTNHIWVYELRGKHLLSLIVTLKDKIRTSQTGRKSTFEIVKCTQICMYQVRGPEGGLVSSVI